ILVRRRRRHARLSRAAPPRARDALLFLAPRLPLRRPAGGPRGSGPCRRRLGFGEGHAPRRESTPADLRPPRSSAALRPGETFRPRLLEPDPFAGLLSPGVAGR